MSFGLKGKVTKKRYVFKKRMVTEVDKEDGVEFCKMTQKDVNGSCTYPKSTPAFMTAEDWCSGKVGVISPTPGRHNFEVKDYISKMLVDAV